MHYVLRFTFYTLIVTLLLAAAVTAQGDEAPRLTVIIEALNVREGPGLDYPVDGFLRRGERVAVTGRHPASGWWQVGLPDGRTGWVSGGSSYVRLSGNTSSVRPVTPQPPNISTSIAPGAGNGSVSSDGTLVFQTASGGAIYAIEADGSNLRYLTTGLDPALSPDGQWVAFTRWQNPQFGALGSVWVVGVDGSGERPVAAGVLRPKSPTWSPDGQRLVFNVQLAGGHPQPKEVCGDHSPPAHAFDIIEPEAEAGGSKFCYKLPPESFWGLKMVDTASGAPVDLPHDLHSFSPTWDPANPWRLVYDGDRGLVNLDLNRAATWPLTADVSDHSPRFSPDGQRLAVSYLQHDHWDIHVMNADGSGRLRLTETPLVTIVEQRLRGEEARSWNNVSPAWSPDGSRIAFLSDRSGAWEIWLMKADGSQQRPMFPPGALGDISLQYQAVDERMISWGR